SSAHATHSIHTRSLHDALPISFLNRHSPACLATMVNFLASPWSRRNFAALAEAVRKGGTANGTGDHTKSHEEIWVNFARSMAPLDRKSTRLNSSHVKISYAVFC